jgi:hypothetical protein
MKKSYFILVALLITAITFAQAPEGFNYQALARDSAGDIIVNTTIAVKFDLRETTVAGSIIYTETHNPTTNENGVFNLVVGQGTTIFGVFNTIDWSTDAHFLEVSIDPANGIAFTSLGTTQLLSVPYALHAKTAESVSGISGTTNFVTKSIDGITLGNSQILDNGTNVGIGTNSPNVSAALDVESTTLGFLPPRMTRAEMTAIASPEEGLTVYCNDCPPKSLYFFNGTDYIAAVDGTVISIPSPYAVIGDFREGGVVFWVDPTDNTHGLVCAQSDQTPGIQWHNGSNVTTGATGAAIGTGSANTIAIISAQGATETDYAAGLARAYTGGGFTDWFLPSKDELNQMYINKAAINATATANGGVNFTGNFYWSSTENDTNNFSAWAQYFTNGYQYADGKNITVNNMRAVRAF